MIHPGCGVQTVSQLSFWSFFDAKDHFNKDGSNLGYVAQENPTATSYFGRKRIPTRHYRETKTLAILRFDHESFSDDAELMITAERRIRRQEKQGRKKESHRSGTGGIVSNPTVCRRALFPARLEPHICRRCRRSVCPGPSYSKY